MAGVVRYALENWPRTARLCVIVVVGAVLLVAVALGFRFWLRPRRSVLVLGGWHRRSSAAGKALLLSSKARAGVLDPMVSQ